MPAIALGLGALAIGGGSFLSGRGAKKEAASKQAFLRDAASKVPLDYQAEISQYLKDIGKLGPAATKAASTTATADQDVLDALREKSAPGSAGRRDKILSMIDSYLAGELSPEMQRGISRSSAARGAARFGNLGGSIPLRAEAAALGRATEQQQQMGMQALGQFNSLFPSAQPISILNFLGGTGTQRLAARGQEQSQMANILSGMPGTPSMMSSYGNALTQVGGMAMGAGMIGMAAGGMRGMGGGVYNPTSATHFNTFPGR